MFFHPIPTYFIGIQHVLTKDFTAFEPQNPEIDELGEDQKSRSTDDEALRL